MIQDLLNIADSLCRVHLAKTNPNGDDPICALKGSPVEWEWWQMYKRKKGGERFPEPTKYIVSFAQTSPRSNVFLFGGIFEILDRTGDCYKVQLLSLCQDRIRRLKIRYNGNPGMATVFTPTHIIKNCEIVE